MLITNIHKRFALMSDRISQIFNLQYHKYSILSMINIWKYLLTEKEKLNKLEALLLSFYREMNTDFEVLNSCVYFKKNEYLLYNLKVQD